MSAGRWRRASARRPGRRTPPVGTRSASVRPSGPCRSPRCDRPRAGARRLILYSTVSTDGVLGEQRERRVAARAVGDGAGGSGVEVAVLLGDFGPAREGDVHAAGCDVGDAGTEMAPSAPGARNSPGCVPAPRGSPLPAASGHPLRSLRVRRAEVGRVRQPARRSTSRNPPMAIIMAPDARVTARAARRPGPQDGAGQRRPTVR